jgi:hypothetical protein
MSLLGAIATASKIVMPHAWPLIAVDRLMAGVDASARSLPPIFVIGPPRTGTTILYQRLLTHFCFTYPSNVDSALFSVPSLAHACSRRFKDNRHAHGDTSDYGYVSGLWGASEAGPMMKYFLDSENRCAKFGAAIRAMSAASDRPYLTKNTVNSIRLPAIHKAFPDAWIVRTFRDRETTARSILRMRGHNGSEEEWAGVRPAGADSVLTADPIDQTRWQYDAVQSTIDADLEQLGMPSFEVRYEAFVADPAAVLNSLVAAYREATGLEIAASGIPIPNELKKPG